MTGSIQIAIASGKGGTGKTMVTTSLASLLNGEALTVDCDVEAANLHLFLNPRVDQKLTAVSFVPDIDTSRCTLCGQCSSLCQFNALLTLKDRVMVFAELCHGCEGCRIICPNKAVRESFKPLGEVIEGQSKLGKTIWGRLKIGEPMAPPLIEKVRSTALSFNQPKWMLIDAPPGTTCPTVAAIRGADFVILVTEPTPFGLHDLRLAVEMTRILNLPFGVVINRVSQTWKAVHEFCDSEGISILAEIPLDMKIAEAYAQGRIIIEAIPAYRPQFEKIMDHIKRACQVNV